MSASSTLEELINIMAKLRDPNDGCLWDHAQTLHTIVPHTIEEAYEVADAIERKDYVDLKDELGDLFFQVLFYSQITKEENIFTLEDIFLNLKDKIIKRHPHVFSDASYSTVEERVAAWEEGKKEERASKALKEIGQTKESSELPQSALSHLPLNLPSLSLAQKIGKRVALVGFEWPNTLGVLGKIKEEVEELSHEINVLNDNALNSDKLSNDVGAADTDKAEAELGDLLFACVNLARHLKVDAEGCLRKANHKFIRRFQALESKAHEQGHDVSELTLEDMDKLWDAVKIDEKNNKT